jgi:hypothetical protein
MAKAKVLLFKDSGKYYTEQEWEIPTADELHKIQETMPKEYRVYDFMPNCMIFSKDFKRTGGTGPVLVETQEPWGFPCLLIYSEGEVTYKSQCPVEGCSGKECEHRA